MIDYSRRAPKTSTQRSREFRERNPHYHRDYRKRRAAEAAARIAAAAEIKALPLLAPLFITTTPQTAAPLALPAPTPQPVIQLPLFNTSLTEATPAPRAA